MAVASSVQVIIEDSKTLRQLVLLSEAMNLDEEGVIQELIKAAAKRQEASRRAGELGLTLTETKIAILVTRGLTSQAIATRLGCGVKTVDTHRASISQKIKTLFRIKGSCKTQHVIQALLTVGLVSSDELTNCLEPN